MADLEIKIVGTADLKSAQAEIGKLGKEVQGATGYLGSLKQEMKQLKAQMDNTSQEGLVNMRVRLAELKREIAIAQGNTESFTKKIGGEFDSALSKASRKLFDLGNILKASVGFLGVAGIAGSFIEATGAAKAMDEAIHGVVDGLKLMNKTGAEISLMSTGSIFEKSQKFLDSQLPAQLQLINEIDAKIKDLQATKFTVDPTSALASTVSAILGTPMPATTRALTGGEQDKINNAITQLRNYRAEIEKTGDSSKKTESDIVDLYDKIGLNDMLEPRINFEPFGATAGNRAIPLGTDPSTWGALAEDAARKRQSEADRKSFEDRLKYENEIVDYQEQQEQKRIQMLDRAGARLGNVFEDAVSAGMRGGFNDFLQNYMQQIGVKALGSFVRLAFSSATGGSYGVGNILGSIFGFAGGGEFYTSGPMPIMVGDNPGGIEKVTVTPISGTGTSGMKNGSLALAGGGSVMASGGQAPINLVLKMDGLDFAYALYSPNGGMERLERMRGN